MKKLSLLSALFFSTVATHAATVNWQAGIDTGFADSSGAALAQRNLLRIGYFTISNGAVAGLANPTVANVGSLNSSFREFGQARVGDTFGVDGSFQANTNFSYPSNPSFSPSSQIYIWAVKATNTATLATVLSTVTEQAIFYVPSASNLAWKFPATDTSPTGPTLDIQQASTTFGGIYLAGSYQLFNPSVTAAFGTTSGAVQLQAVSAVPEASTFIFGVATILAAVGSRRRGCR